MKEGSIVMVAFHQQDGIVKKRPALVLKVNQPYSDILACAISSKLHNYIEGIDYILKNNSENFNETGLKHNMLIRTSFIETFSKDNHITGVIGEVSQNVYNSVIENIINYLKS